MKAGSAPVRPAASCMVAEDDAAARMMISSSTRLIPSFELHLSDFILLSLSPLSQFVNAGGRVIAA